MMSISKLASIGLMISGLAAAREPGGACGVPQSEQAQPPEDLKDVPCKDLRAGKDESRRYFLIGPAEYAQAPEEGWPLLIVLPGGQGNAEFNPFVKRIYKHALGEKYVVAQLVSAPWSDSRRITWPSEKQRAPEVKWTIEAFVRQVVAETAQRVKIDPKRVFTLSWSSGGPAAYALSLMDKTPVTGSFIAMSVFFPETLPSLDKAKGKAYYLFHSPEDRTCTFPNAERALSRLQEKGAEVTLKRYEGGHGWSTDPYGNIRAGMAWLEERVTEEKTP